MVRFPHLDAYLWPLSRPEAYDFLKVTHSMVEYLETYRDVFPQEYQHSMAMIERGHAPLLPPRGDVYAPHEQQFLTCIHHSLFSISRDLEAFFLNADERCYHVPVNPIGFDDQYLYYAGYQVEKGTLLLLYLLGYADDEVFQYHYGNRDEDPLKITVQAETILEIPLGRGEVDGRDLAQACQERQGPIAALKNTLDMLEHDTGNIWLDCTDEMPPDDFPFSASTLWMLADEFRPARQMADQACELIAWLERDPVTHFQEVATLWNSCF